MKKVIRSININQAKKNMILANNVRGGEDELIFSKGYKLDLKSITKIKNSGVSFIYIYEYKNQKSLLKNLNNHFILDKKENYKEEKIVLDSSESDIVYEDEIYSVPAEVIEPLPLKDVISIEVREQNEKFVKNLFYEPEKVTFKTVVSTVSGIVDEILKTKDTIVSIQDLRDHDNYTFQHSVNLCVLGVTIAKMLNYSETRIKEFGIGLILHDFGKVKIPLHILNKPERLTKGEFEIMKNHTIYGYELLNDRYNLPDIAKMVVLHHHEKLDGSGYPKGLKGKEIPEWVQISTIVDVYDALTADRIYKSKWSPRQSVNFLYKRANRWFNKDYIELLEKTIPERLFSFKLHDDIF